jgi:enamine deaminase RidA (YjgF/YER057c/UK114 family)
MKRTLINPGSTRILYDNYHFSQATRVGDMIWVSGQVGIDANMRPAQGLTEQARLAFTNLKTVLEAAGATLDDVVELVTFHIDLRGGSVEFGAVKDEFFPDDYPSWSAVGVTQLAMPELLVEIRGVAVAGSGTKGTANG